MKITFSCPHCKQLLATESVASGFRFQCPTCHNRILTPFETLLDNVKYISPADIIINREYQDIPTNRPSFTNGVQCNNSYYYNP